MACDPESPQPALSSGPVITASRSSLAMKGSSIYTCFPRPHHAGLRDARDAPTTLDSRTPPLCWSPGRPHHAGLWDARDAPATLDSGTPGTPVMPGDGEHDSRAPSEAFSDRAKIEKIIYILNKRNSRFKSYLCSRITGIAKRSFRFFQKMLIEETPKNFLANPVLGQFPSLPSLPPLQMGGLSPASPLCFKGEVCEGLKYKHLDSTIKHSSFTQITPSLSF